MGGASIPTIRTPGTSLTTGAGSLVVGAALALYPAVSGHPLLAPLLPGGAALLILAIALAANWPAAIPWSIGALAGEYLLSLYIRGGPAVVAAAIYGSGLFLAAELAYWSLQSRIPSPWEAALLIHRVFILSVLVLSSLGLGMLITVVIQLPINGSLPLTVVGVAAAAGALALIATFVRSFRT